MTRMEGRLSKTGRTEEFNRQFHDNIDRRVFKCLSGEELEVYEGPVKYISMVEVYKTGPYSTTP
jgi:hypothetical protein